MKGFSTISAILSDFWFINPNYGMAHLDMVTNLLEGKLPILAQGQGNQTANNQNIASRQNVGILNITGPVFKYDGACGEPGYVSYGQQLADLINDDSIGAIILNIDSPGGQGAGLRTFAQQIRNSPKPVIGFVNDGMCCSAAYWIISACSWIVCSQTTDRVGSIGGYMLLVNFIKAAENAGTPIIEVYSSLSSEKNLSVREAMKGKPELLIKEIDQQVQVFINDVTEYRGSKLNLDVADPFKGADYPAQSSDGIDAVSIGLIDEVGSFDTALLRAEQLMAA